MGVYQITIAIKVFDEAASPEEFRDRISKMEWTDFADNLASGELYAHWETGQAEAVPPGELPWFFDPEMVGSR